MSKTQNQTNFLPIRLLSQSQTVAGKTKTKTKTKTKVTASLLSILIENRSVILFMYSFYVTFFLQLYFQLGFKK